MKTIVRVLKFIIFCAIVLYAVYFFNKTRENAILKKVIERLSADSRIAEVIVTEVRREPKEKKTYTTIKFQEYDSHLKPLTPKYFTFSSNIIQFQSLVIRFSDSYVKSGHTLRGKSVYLFMKVFVLKDKDTEVFQLSRINEVPMGYRAEEKVSVFEQRLWQEFWQYALQPQAAKRAGIKNAQIEAPGTKFVPGMLYTLKIEHDGGMRVDACPLPNILKSEKVADQR
jgi:hypothetical protein